MNLSSENTLVTLFAIAFVVTIGATWLACRILSVCDQEIKTDFETLTERNKR